STHQSEEPGVFEPQPSCGSPSISYRGLLGGGGMLSFCCRHHGHTVSCKSGAPTKVDVLNKFGREGIKPAQISPYLGFDQHPRYRYRHSTSAVSLLALVHLPRLHHRPRL